MSDWRDRARCRDYDPELWFPVGSTGEVKEQEAEAKAICALCPVREECLKWALDTGQGAGIWGGKDEGELRLIRRGQQRRRVKSPPPHGTESRYRHHGCRCQICKDGHAAKQREWDQKRRSA